jgi:hypothetical protein
MEPDAVNEADAADRQLAADAGLDEAVVTLLRQHTANPFAPVQPSPDVAGAGAAVRGVSVAVANGAEAEALMEAFVPALAELGCGAFWSERREPNGMKETDEVLVLATQDPYAAIRLRGSDGANYDVSTDDVIARLESWRRLCEFRVVGAAGDWVAIQFETLPENICAFAEDVYLFCPDTVEQGVGLAREADDPQRFARARMLCPEISPRVGNRTSATLGKLGDMDPAVAAQFRALFESAAASATPADMGVRLLADEIRTSLYLHLWWD